MQYIDLSHTIFDGLITYKGLPAPIICDYLSRESSKEIYETGTQFQIAKIEMLANTGTYIDCPFHRYEDGLGFHQLELERFTDISSIKISYDYIREGLAIGPENFMGLDLKGKAVLVETGWDQFWNTDKYFEAHPFLTREAAEYLQAQEISLLGIDALNVDDTRTNSRPVHSILLKENILIVEHLTNLKKLPKKEFYFSAVPPKIKKVGSFPVRAFAKF